MALLQWKGLKTPVFRLSTGTFGTLGRSSCTKTVQFAVYLGASTLRQNWRRVHPFAPRRPPFPQALSLLPNNKTLARGGREADPGGYALLSVKLRSRFIGSGLPDQLLLA